jgi:hypothetical protein
MSCKISIETIPHDQQRYPTVGDWWFDADGTLKIKVSEMGNPDYEFLVGLHELVEVWLCKKRGITDEQVTAFDTQFEKDREAGLHGEDDEPGEDPAAPYKNEHLVAISVEAGVCAALGISWKEYLDALYALP